MVTFQLAMASRQKNKKEKESKIHRQLQDYERRGHQTSLGSANISRDQLPPTSRNASITNSTARKVARPSHQEEEHDPDRRHRISVKKKKIATRKKRTRRHGLGANANEKKRHVYRHRRHYQ
jgi:hypothetical protein